MRINTDGVLLGTWIPIEGLVSKTSLSLLDIGAGCGVISAIMLQRIKESGFTGTLSLVALEPDYGSFTDTEKNLHELKNQLTLSDRVNIEVLQKKIQGFKPDYCFDLIFSNPPFFVNSLKPQDTLKTNIRHTDMLSHTDLILSSLTLLKTGGKLALILPVAEGEMFMKKVADINNVNAGLGRKLSLITKCSIKTTAVKQPKRFLLEFVCSACSSLMEPCRDETLILMENGAWSAAYRALTSNFLIKL